MQATMKLPLQSTTARQFKASYFRIWSLCVFEDDILTCRKDVTSQKSLWRTDCARSVDFIKEESEQDVTLIPGQIHFLSCGKLLSSLFLYWYVFEYHFLVSMILVLSGVYQDLLKRNFIISLFCFSFWFRCWLNLSCRLSSFSNKSISFSSCWSAFVSYLE